MLIADRKILIGAALDMTREANRRITDAMRRSLNGENTAAEYVAACKLNYDGFRLIRRYTM